MMTEMIEAIRAAVAESATPEQKELGAQACRTILAALGAEPGKTIAMPGVPQPHPLAGITADQALTLIIARLSAIVEAKEAAAQEAASQGPAAQGATRAKEVNVAPQRPQAAPQIAFVNPRPTAARPPGAAPVRRRPR